LHPHDDSDRENAYEDEYEDDFEDGRNDDEDEDEDIAMNTQHAIGLGAAAAAAAGLSSRAARRALLALAGERVMPSQNCIKSGKHDEQHVAKCRYQICSVAYCLLCLLTTQHKSSHCFYRILHTLCGKSSNCALSLDDSSLVPQLAASTCSTVVSFFIVSLYIGFLLHCMLPVATRQTIRHQNPAACLLATLM
jgi:hypothetical protein